VMPFAFIAPSPRLFLLGVVVSMLSLMCFFWFEQSIYCKL
jgi:hypothetical protein